jgi:cyclopropane fatty-acyl-phospholipid synthase-like methyltransferase
MEVIEHKQCRLCDSNELIDIYSFGNLYVSNFVEKSQIHNGTKAPLDLVCCPNCSLIQLRHTAPMELMYARHYWYRSGVTQTMKDALKDIVHVVNENITLKAGDTVLDIGANDGTLLSYYNIDGLNKVGCEPADNLIEELKEHADHVLHDFWNIDSYNRLGIERGFGKAKVIMAIGMFYDLEDPSKFIADIKEALAEDGLFVAQLMCLSSMLEKNDVGNICHEHLEYYSLDSLKYLFETNGLEMFHIEQNEVNGGSYRIFVRHYNGTGIEYDEHIRVDDIRAFVERINNNRDACVDFIKNEVAKGKTVYVYGASTKGNTILQYYGLDSSLIAAAAERSPEKWGKYTIGTGIPIITEEQARKEQPDYFFVLPWAFINEFYERETDWRKKGGRFIIPLPEFRVLD